MSPIKCISVIFNGINLRGKYGPRYVPKLVPIMYNVEKAMVVLASQKSEIIWMTQMAEAQYDHAK